VDDKTQLETRIRDLEDKLLRMEKRDSDRIDSAIRTVLPDEARAHMRNAFREQLLYGALDPRPLDRPFRRGAGHDRAPRAHPGRLAGARPGSPRSVRTWRNTKGPPLPVGLSRMG